VASTKLSWAATMLPEEATGDDELLVADDGMTRWLIMNRPEMGNAFTTTMLHAMKFELDRARADRDVRVIVITGKGQRFFCIGGEKEPPPPELDYSTVAPVVDVYQAIDQLPKPVVAAVNGFAVGGGNVLQVMCDLSVAAESAVFRQVGPMVGSFDAGFGTWYLEDLIGRKRAKEMWFLNEKLTAARAFELGLVNFVVPDDELVGRTSEIAMSLTKRGGQALAAIKSSFSARTGGAGGFSRIAHDLLLRDYLQTQEANELQSSFNERRDPDITTSWR
jgi:naphthoate synthase